MKETSNIRQDDFFSSGYNSSEDQEENNFNSPEAKPENIFTSTNKENSEQLSSKILCFPLTLDSYQLINLKSNEDPELERTQLLVILGDLEKIKPNEKILKLIFSSKDKKSLLNLRYYQKEINTLLNIGLDFIGLVQNKLFVKYENDNVTNEAYISLQKSSILFDLLYDEEKQFNCSEDNFEKKNVKKSEEKKEEKAPINNITEETNLNNETKNISNKKLNNFEDYSSPNINVKKNLFPQINKNIKEQQQNQKPSNPIIFPPQMYPNNLFQNNNYQKMPQFNPLLANQILNTNPLYLQTAMAFQNYMKLQQQFQMNNKINKDTKDIFNNLKNYSENMNIFNNNTKINFSNNSNINKNNNLSPINQKESSTNSSSNSSKDSSPTMNYQSKINNMIYNNFKNMKMGMNNGTGAHESNNLEEIIQNKQYKEYVPKNIKEKENDVQFHTNSTRDYQYKYVSRYIVQIENEKNFPVTKMIIGNNGMLLRKILLDNCIKYGDHTTKIRLRGKGSGYKEGMNNEESKDPMELCISSLNVLSFSRCSTAIENLLLQIYYQYYLYQCKNLNNLNNKMGNSPITMKKILKYHYIVNRFNTLIKEEKRRMKEEESNKNNQNKEKNYDNRNSNFSS